MADEKVEVTGLNQTDNVETKSDTHKIWNFDFGAQVREEELDGRHYIVVPMTMILEGVHTGSQGPVYYSIEELAKTPKMWNMKPVLIEHPFRGDTATDLDVYKKQAVGMIMNTHFEDGKLKAEAWIDKDLAAKKYPDLLEHIQYRLPMEVSTGLFSELILEPGTWQGEEYKGRIVNIRADHLAILPHKQGACSLADGAGLLINQSFDAPEEGGDGKKETLNIISTIVNQDYPSGTYVVDELGADEAATAEEKEPRLKNQPTDTEVPVYAGAQPQVIRLPDGGIITYTPPPTPTLDGTIKPMERFDDGTGDEDDEEDDIPTLPKERMMDNSTILSPAEAVAEEQEDEVTGERDQYMELYDGLRRFRNALMAINRRIATKNKRTGSKKKISGSSTKRLLNRRGRRVVKNDESLFPSFKLPEGVLEVPDRVEGGLYGKYLNDKKLAQFANNIQELRYVSDVLKSLLLDTFHVSKVDKIKTILDKVRANGGNSPIDLGEDAPLFSEDDMAFLDHVLTEYAGVNKELAELESADADFRSRVQGVGGNDKKYNYLYNLITGIQASHYADTGYGQLLRRFADRFAASVAKNGKSTKKDPFMEHLINDADKLAVTVADPYKKQKNALGQAAVTLKFWMDKGIKSDHLADVVLDSCSDAPQREKLRKLYDRIKEIINKVPLVYGDGAVEDVAPSPKGRTKRRKTAEDEKFGQAMDAALAEVKDYLRKPTDTEGAIYYFGKNRIERMVLEQLAKQLVKIAELAHYYDYNLSKAKRAYDAQVEKLDSIPLSDESKEYFRGFADMLGDKDYQQKIIDQSRNDAELQRLMFRYRRSERLNQGVERGIGALLAQELLGAVGAIDDPKYANNEEMRASAIDVLTKDPVLVKQVIGPYEKSYQAEVNAGNDVEKNNIALDKIKKLLKSDDYVTKDEFLANDEKYQKALVDYYKLVSGYDPEVGYTPEQMIMVGLDGPSVGKHKSKNFHNDYFSHRIKNPSVAERHAAAGGYAGIVPTIKELGEIALAKLNASRKGSDYGSRYNDLNEFGYRYDPDILKNFKKRAITSPYLSKLDEIFRGFQDRRLPMKASLVLSYSPSAQTLEQIQTPSESQRMWKTDDVSDEDKLIQGIQRLTNMVKSINSRQRKRRK